MSQVSISLADVTVRSADAVGPSNVVALWDGKLIERNAFLSHVYSLYSILVSSSQKRWALFSYETYPFAVALFALSLANKIITIPSNITANTLSILRQEGSSFIGDIPGADICITSHLQKINVDINSVQLPDLDLKASELTIFTSGSGGEPKAIKKSLSQFNYEVCALEKCFGHHVQKKDVEQAYHIATVSHQHIYGLIFRVFWPLAAGRMFISEQIPDTTQLLKIAISRKKSVVWIASPAHLNRIDSSLPWDEAREYLITVFSSGGPLSEYGADLVTKCLGKPPVEIFGSSETGGIAYRDRAGQKHWQVLPGVKIKTGRDRALYVLSPHIDVSNWYRTEDAVEAIDEDSFILEGRLDRIVKIEGKRLSLDELEARLCSFPQVAQSYCTVLKKSTQIAGIRETLACVCELSPIGSKEFRELGKLAFMKLLKQQLENYFERSLMPKKWRFVESIPTNAQAKVDRSVVIQMFESP